MIQCPTYIHLFTPSQGRWRLPNHTPFGRATTTRFLPPIISTNNTTTHSLQSTKSAYKYCIPSLCAFLLYIRCISSCLAIRYDTRPRSLDLEPPSAQPVSSVNSINTHCTTLLQLISLHAHVSIWWYICRSILTYSVAFLLYQYQSLSSGVCKQTLRDR